MRRIAAELGLEVAAKPDSQDICFVPDGDYAGLVKRLRPETEAPGEIVDLEGECSADIAAWSISPSASDGESKSAGRRSRYTSSISIRMRRGSWLDRAGRWLWMRCGLPSGTG